MTTVLVIEDEPDALANLVLMLEMEGFRALSADNGRTGLQLARRELPDLILCDISMPEMDGYGVLDALRSEPATSAIPFIFLTARGERKDLRHGMDHGADDYLSKPASADEVLAAINARLRRHRVHEDALMAKVRMEPDFSSPKPLESLGLTAREAEVLVWIAQGKSNSMVATILGCTENTVKVHVTHIFDKLGCDSRHAAAMRAVEVLQAARLQRRRT